MITLLAMSAAAAMLTGCVGMSAPYGEVDRPAYTYRLIPVTPNLVMQLALEKSQSSAPAAEDELPLTAAADYAYRIKAGDILSISVPSIVSFNSANAPSILGDQGQQYLVYNDGTIYLPFSGPVSVVNRTLRNAQEAVVSALSGYLRSPQVVVTVQQYRSQRVMVTGQVDRPGYMPITDVPLTLIGALSTSGAISDRRGATDPRLVGSPTTQVSLQNEYPDLSKVVLKRAGKSHVIDVHSILNSGDTQKDPILLDGDTVVVPSVRRANIFVLGEIQRTGLMEVNIDQIDLATVIMSGGGINQLTANPSRVYVIRGEAQKPLVYQLDAGTPDGMLLAREFALQPNDVIYVAETGSTRWNRSLQQIMPTVQGLLSTAIIANTVDDLKNNY